MTVAENIAYPLKVGGVPAAERSERVRAAAARVELEGYLDRKPQALSGGQRQRVALARAIVRTPQLFLMDEPLSNLDAKLRVSDARRSSSICSASSAITTIYVTHDQVEAMTLADRVAVMSQGKLQQVGPPLEIYNRPQNVFVAGFVGNPSMNLITASADPGRIVASGFFASRRSRADRESDPWPATRGHGHHCARKAAISAARSSPPSSSATRLSLRFASGPTSSRSRPTRIARRAWATSSASPSTPRACISSMARPASAFPTELKPTQGYPPAGEQEVSGMTADLFLGGEGVLPISRAAVFFDGQYSEPRLHHPEGVAVGPDGAVWCGNAEGDILRIEPDGSAHREDRLDRRVLSRPRLRRRRPSLRLRPAKRSGAGGSISRRERSPASRRRASSSRTTPWSTPREAASTSLTVSTAGKRGPGVWRYDLATGRGELWWGEPMNFANGMALAHDGRLCSSSRPSSARSAASRSALTAGRRSNRLCDTPSPACRTASPSTMRAISYVSCYEPSRILRVDRAESSTVYIEDLTAHVLCHPTNIAFDGATLYSANLGRWHITKIAARHCRRPRWYRARTPFGEEILEDDTTAPWHDLGPPARLSIRSPRACAAVYRRASRLSRSSGRAAASATSAFSRSRRWPSGSTSSSSTTRSADAPRRPAAFSICGRSSRLSSSPCWSARASARRPDRTTMAAASGACRPTPRRRSRAIARTFSPRSAPMGRHERFAEVIALGEAARERRQVARPARRVRATPPASSRPSPPTSGRRSAKTPTTCFRLTYSTTSLDYLVAAARRSAIPASPD